MKYFYRKGAKKNYMILIIHPEAAGQRLHRKNQRNFLCVFVPLSGIKKISLSLKEWKYNRFR